MRRCRFSKHFQRTVKETDASKLFDFMKGEFHESITQREMESIQNNLQQLDTKKKRRFVYRENYKQNVAKYAAMLLSVVLQQPLEYLNTYFLI